MQGLAFAFAVTAAVMLGANKIPLRMSFFGLDESVAQLISVLLALPMFGLPLLFYFSGRLPSPGTILILALAGITNNGIGRFLIWKSIGAIGANRGNVFSSTQTLYAVALAVTFLGQPIDLYSGVGIALVFLGILIVSLGRMQGTAFTKSQLRSGLIYGLAGGFFWGIAQVLMQIGAAQYHDAITDSFFTFAFSLVVALPLAWGLNRKSRAPLSKADRRTLALIAGASVLGNLGLYFRYLALTTIPLTIVSTINATNPIVTLLLSQFLIRDVELISRRVVIAILVSIVGVVLLSF